MMLKQYTDRDMNVACAIGFIIGVVLCGGVVAVINGCTSVDWKAEAVERGYAEYDNQTGKWQWIEKRAKAEEE